MIHLDKLQNSKRRKISLPKEGIHFKIQCLPDLNEFGFNESFRFNELVSDSNKFFTPKNFGFSEFLGLMNYRLGPNQFVKSGRHCIIKYVFTRITSYFALKFRSSRSTT